MRRRVKTMTVRPADHLAEFASDVHYYLSLRPRQLPSRYLYDALGSALFNAICHLPWYRVARAETRLLGLWAGAIFAKLARLSTIVELGPGSGQKLTTLVAAGRTRSERLDIGLVDISPSALALSRDTVAVLPNLRVETYEGPYEAGLAEALQGNREGRALVLFLGSNVGNFDPPGADAFLTEVRASLAVGDGLVLGTDLVKPERELLLAYDDPLGITAAFNRNLLVRINRELGGDFDIDGFTHRALWNARASRVEMHLVSRRHQQVRIDAADLNFEVRQGESIWTESSYKYRPAEVERMLERNGFSRVDQWIDEQDGFAITLAEVG
jgi:dimethylhistidine N-methyltransferase